MITIKKHIRQYENTVLDMGINTEYKWPVGFVRDGIKQERIMAHCSWIMARVCKTEQNKMEDGRKWSIIAKMHFIIKECLDVSSVRATKTGKEETLLSAKFHSGLKQY